MAANFGYSYRRFSTKPQSKGDSNNRQVEAGERWAAENGYTLDGTLNLADFGVSAFNGKNAEIGALGKFLAAVDAGSVKKGSALIVESLDRLSREEVPDALELFLGILRRGIDIVTLIPNPEFFCRSRLDTTQLIIAIVCMSRAHEESAVKSSRGKRNWAVRRERMAAGKTIKNICPRWLTYDAELDRYRPNEKAKTVAEIFRLYLAGDGCNVVSYKLNDLGKVPLQHGRKWSGGQVRHVLTCRQVIGERQPRQMVNGKALPVGDVIKGYFPAIVSDGDFYKAQAQLNIKRVSKLGRRGKYVTSLFTGLLVSHHYDKSKRQTLLEPWTIATMTDRNNGHLTIKGLRPKPDGKKRFFHLPYAMLEREILLNLKELDVNELTGNSYRGQLEIAQARLSDIRRRLGKLETALTETDDVTTLIKAAKKLETEEKRAIEEVDALESVAACTLEDNVQDLKTLVAKLDSTEEKTLTALRAKLKSRLAATIETIVVDITESTPLDRHVTLRVTFRNCPKMRVVVLRFRRDQRHTHVEAITSGYDCLQMRQTG